MNTKSVSDTVKEAAEKLKKVTWLEPDIYRESKKFFENLPVQKMLVERGITFDQTKDFDLAIKDGTLTNLTKNVFAMMKGVAKGTADFKKRMQDPDYAKKHESLKKSYEEKGFIKMYAPIVIRVARTGDYIVVSNTYELEFALVSKLPIEMWLVDR